MTTNDNVGLPKPTKKVLVTNPLRLSSSISSTVAVSLDSLAILLSGLLAYAHAVPPIDLLENLYTAAVCFVWLTSLMLMNFGGLYEFSTIIKPAEAIKSSIVSIGASFLFLLAAAFALEVPAEFSRAWLWEFALSSLLLLLSFRFLSALLIHRLVHVGLLFRNVAVIGNTAQAQPLLNRLEGSELPFIRLTGVWTNAEDQKAHKMALEKVLDLIANGKVDDVFIALPWSDADGIAGIVTRLREKPVNVYLGADLIGSRMTCREPPNHFSALPIFELVGKPLSGWDVGLKATVDYLLATCALICLTPFLLFVAILIKLSSKGPVVFRQKRLGFNNQAFDIYKFRSMYHANDTPGKTMQAVKGDPRVTRLGRILRKTSIDELPQLINVLNGSMSLVGPRPHALDHNEEYSQRIRGYFARHRVKPGITGLAQVRGLRGETDTPEKMEARVKSDIEYIDNWSLTLDFKILFRTLIIVFGGRNAY